MVHSRSNPWCYVLGAAADESVRAVCDACRITCIENRDTWIAIVFSITQQQRVLLTALLFYTIRIRMDLCFAFMHTHTHTLTLGCIEIPIRTVISQFSHMMVYRWSGIESLHCMCNAYLAESPRYSCMTKRISYERLMCVFKGKRHNNIGSCIYPIQLSIDCRFV